MHSSIFCRRFRDIMKAKLTKLNSIHVFVVIHDLVLLHQGPLFRSDVSFATSSHSRVSWPETTLKSSSPSLASRDSFQKSCAKTTQLLPLMAPNWPLSSFQATVSQSRRWNFKAKINEGNRVAQLLLLQLPRCIGLMIPGGKIPPCIFIQLLLAGQRSSSSGFSGGCVVVVGKRNASPLFLL